MQQDPFIIHETEIQSRLLIGSGKYQSGQQMQDSILAAESELVTVALKRVKTDGTDQDLLPYLKHDGIRLLPNTSGARNAQEAILAAELAREAMETNWLKLEIHPDQKYLMPDPLETLVACEELAKRGFIILPYIHADPVLCKRLEEAGTAAVMPLGAPIGSNLGLETKRFLEIIVEQSNVPVIVDAGIGKPSQAAAAMELGADAVLVNTAIAAAQDPIAMSVAFKQAVIAGRTAYLSGMALESRTAIPTSPLEGFIDALNDE